MAALSVFPSNLVGLPEGVLGGQQLLLGVVEPPHRLCRQRVQLLLALLCVSESSKIQNITLVINKNRTFLVRLLYTLIIFKSLSNQA